MAKSIFSKYNLVIITLILLLFLMLVVNTSWSGEYIPFWEVFRSFVGLGDETTSILIELRLPRMVVAVLVGIALGIAGAILQGIVHNPLASPEMLGVTNGASAAAVGFIALSAGTISIHWLPLVALIGAFFAMSLVYFFAWKQGVTPFRFALIGFSISIAMNSLTIFMIKASPIYIASQAMGWITGTVYGSSWEHVTVLIPWLLIFVPLAFIFANDLSVLELGDEVATGLGAFVERYRFILLFVSVALASAAVGIAGGISFIGLMAPHIARKLVGRNYVYVFFGSALVGALILLVADLMAKTLFHPLDLPAGIFTAAVGAPFFLYLLYRMK